MPNWCFNRVTVYGSTEDLSAFKEFVESDTSTLDFNRIMPEPAEIAAVEYHVPPDGSTVTS